MILWWISIIAALTMGFATALISKTLAKTSGDLREFLLLFAFTMVGYISYNLLVTFMIATGVEISSPLWAFSIALHTLPGLFWFLTNRKIGKITRGLE